MIFFANVSDDFKQQKKFPKKYIVFLTKHFVIFLKSSETQDTSKIRTKLNNLVIYGNHFGQFSKNSEYKFDHISKTKNRKCFFHRFQNIAHLLSQSGNF